MTSSVYDDLVEAARSDPRIVGLILTGSRGRAAFVRAESDRDVRLVVRWELETFPLPGDRWSAGRLLPRLQAVAGTAASDEQQRLFRDVEQLARERGFGAIIDGWEPDVAWLRGDVAVP